MSEGTELQQTLQMPDVLVAETGLAERMQSFGNRVVELAQQGWDNARRYVPRFALAGLAVTGTVEASPADAASTYHHRTTLTTQTVLNRIHNTIPSGDFTQGNHKILVTYAALKASMGAYKTNCNNPYAVTYKSYKINMNGTTSTPCGTPIFTDKTRTEKGEFTHALNRQGSKIREAAGLAYTQSTKSITGNRKEVTAVYRCPPTGKGVEQIVLDRRYASNGTQYSTATITKC